MSEEYAAIFREEATELLEELESALLELEETPEDLEIVGRVFRAMHTIKGSGAMFGFDVIADFTHHVETVLDKVRDGSVPATKQLIDLILSSRDHVCNLLELDSPTEADIQAGTTLIEKLQNLLDGGGDEPPEPAEDEKSIESIAPEKETDELSEDEAAGVEGTSEVISEDLDDDEIAVQDLASEKEIEELTNDEIALEGAVFTEKTEGLSVDGQTDGEVASEKVTGELSDDEIAVQDLVSDLEVEELGDDEIAVESSVPVDTVEEQTDDEIAIETGKVPVAPEGDVSETAETQKSESETAQSAVEKPQEPNQPVNEEPTDYAFMFKEEASELLEDLETSLLDWEENPDDSTIINKIFRVMHTIKGSGAMFGFDSIADFTHHVETVLGKVREGSLPASKSLIKLVLLSRDHICDLLAAEIGEGKADPKDGESLIVNLTAALSGKFEDESPAPSEKKSVVDIPKPEETPQIKSKVEDIPEKKPVAKETPALEQNSVPKESSTPKPEPSVQKPVQPKSEPANEYADIFKEEATELLEELEAGLLELEETPDDLETVGKVFRAMHTIKGSGAMFGFDVIADFTHHVETALDKVRDGSIPASKDLINLVLKSRDHISNLLAFETGEGDVDHQNGEDIIQGLKYLMDGGSVEESSTPELSLQEMSQASITSQADQETKHYRIVFRPGEEFFKTGGDVDSIVEELKSLGELIVTGNSNGTQEQYESGEVKAYWDLLLHSPQDENRVRDTFIFAENNSDIEVMELGEDSEDAFPEHQRLGDILLERGELERKELNEALKEQKQIGQVLVEKKIVTPDKVNSALKEQEVLAQRRKVKTQKKDSLRVAADKLDYLINLVGEMVVTQARLTEIASRLGDSELLEPVEEVERLTAELRDCVLNIRMLPIGTTFSRFKRLVRDLSVELGKEVDLVTLGAETELDKTVIESLNDPLVHLIRNSIDHGIEPPETRINANKPKKGTITLEALHSGAHVIIKVIDDGKGLDPEAIKRKAIEKGHIDPDADLSKEELLKLIFGAGVSTASEITEVSGRGVGMDVVKSTIEGKLKGSVQIESEIGVGTTISITLPLTLAIIDGLLVKVAQTHFVLPLTQVEECVELSQEDIERFHGRKVFAVREQLIPYVNMRDFYMLPGSESDVQQMVVVNLNGEKVGLVLDDVIGGHQTVIKSLGWVYRNAQGVSGATILGNGEVALIVDVANLIKNAQLEEQTV